MTIALDTPEQIAMWVLLSRRHQLQSQMKGIKTPGLIKWCQANIEGAGRTAKSCVVPVEYAISQAGGEVDYNLVNLHVMYRQGGLFHDQGIFSHPDDMHEGLKRAYEAGRLEIVLTLDEPRESNRQVYVPA